MKDFIAQYWMEMLFTAFVGVMGALYRGLSQKVKRRILEQDSIREGMLAMLHDRLYSGCEELIQKGACSVEAMKNLEYLYNSYHKLGGNGTGTELFERVKGLPIR